MVENNSCDVTPLLFATANSATHVQCIAEADSADKQLHKVVPYLNAHGWRVAFSPEPCTLAILFRGNPLYTTSADRPSNFELLEYYREAEGQNT